MAASNRLDRVGAVRRAQRIRDGVSSISEVLDTLIEVQERQDWTSLGHKDFDEYCAVEFGPDQLKLSAERRGQVVGILIAGGMSKRGAAKALGVSEGTVRNDVKRSKGAQNYAPPAVEPQANDGPAPADIPDAMTQAITDVVSSVGAGVEFRPAFTESRCPETVDPKHCAAGCGTPISWSDGTGGHLRCRKCDPSSLHHAIPDGDDWLPQCKYCTEISGSGDGASPVAGSGHGQENGWTGPNGANPEERIEEEAVEPPVDTPAASTALPGEDTSFPLVSEPQQPGQDSPTGLEGARSETDSSAGPDREGRPASTGPSTAVATTVLPGTDHHRAGVSGGGHAPDEVTSVELEELEDGGVLPPESPSSGDPELLLELFAAILQALDRVDVGALAPLLLTDEMQRLHEAADRVATFVGLLETWRTP